MAWKLWDFTSERGVSVIVEWLADERISRRDVGQLNHKLDMLALNGPALPPKLLAGPIYKHIYKLIIHGDRMLRPMLCKGPFDMEGEYTLLLGAIESDMELDSDPRDAEVNRQILIANQKRRIKHERY
jgi:hypothetical protein